MKIKIVPKSEAAGWVRNLHETRPSVVLGTLLAGDRWSCVETAVVAEEKSEIVGIATIAPKGEQMSGEPTVVGLYVLPQFRSQGVGFALLEATISYMLQQGMEPVRLDVLNSKVFRMIQRFPEETQKRLKVVDASLGGLTDIVMEM